MDGPPLAGSTAHALRAKGLETEPTSATPRRAGAGDPGRGNPGKPVGAVVAAAKVLGPSSLLLLDWVGAAFRTDLYVTVGRQYPGPAGASGVIMGAFGSGNEKELEALFSEVAWYRKPSFADVLARVREARQCGFAVDRGTMFQGITQVSVPVLSPSWELLLVLTAAGQAHDVAGDAVGPLSRAMQSAAARLSESVRLLRLG